MDRYSIIMVSSLTIASLYLILATVTLIMSKCRLSLVSFLIISTFAYSFSVKAVSDTMRQKDMKLDNLITTFTSLSDRLNVLGMLYLSFLVQEVTLKLRSQSLAAFKIDLEKFKKRRLIVYIIYGLLTIPVFVLFCIRAAYPNLIN